MLGKFKNFTDQLQLMQKLAKDENFRAFMMHPKVQKVFRDPEFQEVLKSKDAGKMMTHAKFSALMQDPEIVRLMSRVDPKIFFQA